MLTAHILVFFSFVCVNSYLPDYISGDFDSICPDVMNFYKAKVGQVCVLLTVRLCIVIPQDFAKQKKINGTVKGSV